MGQIMKVYLDWQLSGDDALAARSSGREAKRALEFAWIPAAGTPIATACSKACSTTRTTSSSTGRIRMCGIYYLGALRAVEEMARAVGDAASAAEYRRLFEQGSEWIDANLFNGEYYIQQVRGVPRRPDRARRCCSTMGVGRHRAPEYQMGDGCLVDQLVGQYLAEVAGLGPLVVAGEHPQDARVASTATTTSAVARRARTCSGRTR